MAPTCSPNRCRRGTDSAPASWNRLSAMVAVIRGNPPEELHETFRSVLARIQPNVLKHWRASTVTAPVLRTSRRR